MDVLPPGAPVRATMEQALQRLQQEQGWDLSAALRVVRQLVMERLMRQDILKRYPEDTDLLEDVIIENKQAMEMCSIYRDIMSNTTDAFASIINNNLNITMKVLTALTVLFAVPTLVMTIWGINVPVPFERQAWGFAAVCGISIILTLFAFVIMRRKNMF